MDTMVGINHIAVVKTRKPNGNMQCALILRKQKEDREGLVIEVSDYIYEVIDMILKRESPMRPLVYEFIGNFANDYGIFFSKILIERVQQNERNGKILYHAIVEIQKECAKARRYALMPSEAVILALYSKAPIYVQADVFSRFKTTLRDKT